MHEQKAETPTIKYFVIEEHQVGRRYFARTVKIPVGSEPPYAEAFLINGLEVCEKQQWLSLLEKARANPA